MGVKNNKVMKNWVHNFYTPENEIYKSGFIMTEFTNKYGNAFQRLVILPEIFFIELENKIIEKYGKKGKDVLKKIGRIYGYNFACTIGAPRRTKNSKEEILEFIYFIINYGFSSWTKNVEILSFEVKENFSDFHIHLKYDEFIACNKNGKGFLLKEYTPLGFLEYVFEKRIKIKNSKCQGRGDKFCEVEYVQDNSRELPEMNYFKNNFQKYKSFNEIVYNPHSNISISEMLSSKIIKVNDGKFIFKNKTILAMESSFLDLIELEINELSEGKELLFEISHYTGNNFLSEKETLLSISQILSAFGYGDIFIKKNKNIIEVHINHYPWTPLREKTGDFTIFKGFCSGILSNITKNEVRFIINEVHNKFRHNKQNL
jgi:hypothetical protein